MDEKLPTKITTRPPIVTILGHIDHGKTTLLDYIRRTNVATKEAGGITQKIGAYQISLNSQKITFIDTPGHAAFEKMRSRGAKVADIAVLVVAADDGVKPQTIEAIKHIENSKIPVIVAINKLDLVHADPAKIKNQLASNQLLVEELGGKIPSLELSAKTGQHVKDLLDLILLVAELEEVQVNFDSEPEAIVIESSLDKSKGPIATILVKEGSFKIGDEIIVDGQQGKIKTMTDSSGNKLSTAQPSTPVEMLGLKMVPAVGAILKKGTVSKKAQLPQTNQIKSSNVMIEREEKKQKLKLLIKSDTYGSLEAINANLPEEVSVIHAATGDINESDVLLAKSSNAQIYGFNVKTPSKVEKLAKSEKITLIHFVLIYDLLKDIEDKIKKYEQEKIKKNITAIANIIARFEKDNLKIAGCKIITGTFTNNSPIRLIREGNVVAEAKINSLKHGKSNIQQANIGTECGISFLPELDFQIGDSIELLAHNL